MIAAAYSGLSVAQMQDLRRRIAEDATFAVVKNTLARRAAEAAEREEMLEYLAGPTGVVFVTGDAARAAKALSEFAKESDDLFAARGGLLDGEPLTKEQFTALSKLPSRDELIAQLAGGIAAPLFALSGLSQPLTKLAYGLVQLRDQMPSEEAPPDEPAPAAEEPAAEEAPATEDAAADDASAEDVPAAEEAPAAEESPAEQAPEAEAPAEEAPAADADAEPKAEEPAE